MSDLRGDTGAVESLNFDRVDFKSDAAAVTTCAICQQAIGDSYYQVNAHTVCPSCRERLALETSKGTPLGRGLKAAIYGTGAGLAGCVLYWLVGRLSGYEFGLIAIVVGFIVGKAVRAGSGGRGGPAYQALAMAITYAAIAGTNVPAIVNEIGKNAIKAPTQAAAPAAPAPPADGPHGAAFYAGAPLFLLRVFGLAMALPFLAGIQNIMGIVILGIGLYEAWKLNARRKLEISGPFRMMAPARAPAAGD